MISLLILAGYLLLLSHDPGHLVQAPALQQGLEEGYEHKD